uniref:Uncharacterized protein n=1 Tax=Hordeum vulgare subsp. vulgare TaxID=112509 RepID=A0A8I6XL82_HORVV
MDTRLLLGGGGGLLGMRVNRRCKPNRTEKRRQRHHTHVSNFHGNQSCPHHHLKASVHRSPQLHTALLPARDETPHLTDPFPKEGLSLTEGHVGKALRKVPEENERPGEWRGGALSRPRTTRDDAPTRRKQLRRCIVFFRARHLT